MTPSAFLPRRPMSRAARSRSIGLALAMPFLLLAGCTDTMTGGGMTPVSPPRTPAATVGVSGTDAAAAAAAEARTGAVEGALATGTAASAAAGNARLGTTIASLGDATQPGLWIRTPLARAPGKGRLVNPANGRSVDVQLIPLSGAASAGSQVSLPALQALGAGLTDLPEIEVYRA